MFQTRSLGFVLLAAILVSAASISFDLRNVKYQQANDYWTVDIPCTGGVGPYTYEFDLPSGWKNEGNKIKIPSSCTSQFNNQYAVRCRVRDNGSPKGQLLERSLVFKPFSQDGSTSLQVTDRDYFYGNSDLSQYSNSGSLHGIDVLKRLNSLTANMGQNVNLFQLSGNSASYSTVGSGSFLGSSSDSGSGASYSGSGSLYSGSGASYSGSGSSFSGAGSFSGSSGYSSGIGKSSQYGNQNGYSSSSSSSSSYSSQSSNSKIQSNGGYSSSSYGQGSSFYSGLPSISQLDKFIAGGDIVEILQAIQLVVDAKIKCEAKSSYLSDFLGRICAAVEIKKFKLNQLKAIVSTAVTQISKLTAQIQTIKTQKESLHLSELQYQLDNLIKQLKAAYDEYNNYNSNFSGYQTQITNLEREINEINQKYSQVQQKIDSLKRQAQSIDAEIAQYEQRIRKLKIRRSSVQSDITSSETFINERQIKIKQLRDKITALKTKISNASTQKDKLKQIYLSLEKQINSVKESLRINQGKFDQYEQQIVSITVEIERYQKQTSEIEVKQVAQCLENLQSAMAQIKQSIDFVSYHCYDASDIEIDYDNKERRGSYHFGKNQWFGYVNKCYGDLAEQIRNKIASSFQNQVVEISTINVFSDVWKRNYGAAFQSEIQSRSRNDNTDKSYGFSSDFSCSAEFGNQQTKSGVIQNITSNQLVVRGDDGRDYNIRLGSCSKFEGQGKDFVPKKGNNVFWKGSRKDSSYNLHSCTCY